MTTESQALLDNISNALAESCPLVFADTESLTTVAGKIKGYIEKIQSVPSIDAVIGWANPLESELKRKADEHAAADAAERERTEERRRERESYLSGSDADKEQVVRELKERNRPRAAQTCVPTREYSDQEVEAMDSETYRRLVIGDTSRVEDKNLQTRSASQVKTLREIRRKQLLKKPQKDSQLNMALRRMIITREI